MAEHERRQRDRHGSEEGNGKNMKYTVCRNFEWTYPDIHSYATSATAFEAETLRGSVASFQVHIYDCKGAVGAWCDISGAELYEALPIPVEACPGFEENEKAPHFPEREAPFLVNDCLKPFCDAAELYDGSCTLYVVINTNSGSHGDISGCVHISDGCDTAEVPVRLKVLAADAPEEKLEILMGLGMYRFAGESWEEYLRLEGEYLAMLRRMHQNRLYVNPPYITEKDGKRSFDFTDTDRYVSRAVDMGFHAFHLPDVGYRASWESDLIRVGGYDFKSEEGKAYLKDYLGALKIHLRENGWEHMFFIGIADEPNEINSESFCQLSREIKRIYPEIKLYDAVADTDIDGSALDIWVPRCDQYEKGIERFEAARKRGGEIWHYVCLFPREAGYANRFMDIPLLSTRYLYWGNYKYSLSGYLHWTVNDYQSGIDPFKASCPLHINAGSESILPPGDDKLIYPGEGHPWMSIRLENHRESAEEYAMLCRIAEDDKAAADILCAKVFSSFKDNELDPAAFDSVRRELLEAYEKCCNNEK